MNNIHSGKGREVPRENVWVPDIPFTYVEFKEKADIDKMTEMTNMPTKISAKKTNGKKREKDESDVIVEVGKAQSTLAPITENDCPKHKISCPKKSI